MDHHQIPGRSDRSDQSGKHTVHLLFRFCIRIGQCGFFRLFAQRIGHGSVSQTGFRGMNLVEIAAQGGLGHLDALVRENLRQLRLRGNDARQQRLLDGAQSSGPCGRTLQRRRLVRHQANRLSSPRALPASQVSSAFCACRRLPASSQTTDCGPSMTSEVTSLPRYAGRQCWKMASSLA